MGVILNPSRPFPATWDEHRMCDRRAVWKCICLTLFSLCRLAGPPLSNDTALVKLLEHGVTVGLGVREAWAARNTRFDLSWVCWRFSAVPGC